MPQGISRTTLENFIRLSKSVGASKDSITTLEALLEQHEELYQWLPIDENTPKDVRLFLHYTTYYDCLGMWNGSSFKPLVDPECYDEEPTHYFVVPKDPE